MTDEQRKLLESKLSQARFHEALVVSFQTGIPLKEVGALLGLDIPDAESK